MRLTAENLAARRGEDLIFVNVSFSLQSGEVLILTGPNGSGKSTLLRAVAGLLPLERGRIRLDGADAGTEVRVGEVSHYLGHRNAMKQELTVAENLAFWKTFLTGSAPTGGQSIEDAAGTVGLGDITHLPYGYLSAGQQRRFAMAKLLVAHRPIWLLDEPTAALDAGADRMFAGLVESHLGRGGIVIAATHQPLGLGKAQEIRMSGFAGIEGGVWG